MFREQYESFIFQSSELERGFKSYFIKDSHYLPIPYPRYLSEGLISQDGLIRPKGSTGHEFLQQMPSVTKLMFDGQYLKHVEGLHSKLKNISATTRYNLLRENDNMEEDEWRDRVEQLKTLAEQFRELALSDEPSNESGEDSDQY